MPTTHQEFPQAVSNESSLVQSNPSNPSSSGTQEIAPSTYQAASGGTSNNLQNSESNPSSSGTRELPRPLIKQPRGGGGGPSNSLQNTEPPPNTPSPPVIPPSNTNHSSRLPKLNLPTFSGNLLNWSTVRDSFEAAVHSNTTLGAVQKFSYLKAGNASRAIAGFPLNNINYEQAVKLLKERQSIKKFATVL